MADTFQYNEQTHELFIKRQDDYTPYPGGLGKYYFDRLNQIAAENEHSVAQIQSETGKTQTFKQLLQSSIKLAQYMRAEGIKPGDNISMCSYNHLNSEVVVLAVYFVGAVMSSTDPQLSLQDTKHLLNLIQPKTLFVSDGSEELIEAAIEAIQCEAKIISVSLVHHDKYETIEGILENIKSEEIKNFKPYFADDLNTTSSIIFSSGTTGLPKGICLPHSYFLMTLSLLPKDWIKLILFNYTTFYWVSCMDSLAMSLKFESTRLLARSFNKETHWSLCAKYKVNHLFVGNGTFMDVGDSIPENDELDLTSIKVILSGGGPITKTAASKYTKRFPNSHIGFGYAFTEGGLVSYCKPGDKAGTIGKPFSNNQTIKIVDPETEINLPLTKIGEIRIKKNSQMNGYYKMDSSDAWDAQGFLKTGDLGYFDDDYYLHIVDRIKEMFKYQGWHITPAKIEHVFASHPDVRLAIVLGKPTEDGNENLAMALVCLHPGATASAEELERFVNQRMDNVHQIRAGVKIIQWSDIEFTPTGKIRRKFMKDKFVTA